MNKIINLTMITLAFLFAVFTVNAAEVLVTGVVSDTEGNHIAGADVEAVCANDEIKSAVTGADGSFSMLYADGACTTEDVTVSAYTTEGQFGVVERPVQEINGISFDVVIADIEVVPEFGLVPGMLALFGSIGSFLWARRP